MQESGKYQPLVVQYLVDHFGGVKPGERKRHMQRLAYLHALVTLMKVSSHSLARPRRLEWGSTAKGSAGIKQEVTCEWW